MFVVPALRSGKAYRFMFETAPIVLAVHGLKIVSHWLTETTVELAASRIMRLRLHYERRGWPTRHNKIQVLCQASITNIAQVEEGIVTLTSDTLFSEELDQRVAEELLDPVNALLRQGLVEVRRLMSFEIQYTQAIFTEYIIRPLNQRGMLRRSFRALWTHLENIVTDVSKLLAALQPWTQESTLGARDGFLEQCEDRLQTCDIEGEFAQEE